MFWQNRKCKKAVDVLGPHIHKQIVSAMKARSDVFSNPSEMAFFAGYMRSLIWDILDKIGCKDYDVQTKMIKHVCEGVIPGRLWNVFERGEALSSSFLSGLNQEAENAKESLEKGTECGLYDASEFDYKSIAPDNLRRYLTGESVNTNIDTK